MVGAYRNPSVIDHSAAYGRRAREELQLSASLLEQVARDAHHHPLLLTVSFCSIALSSRRRSTVSPQVHPLVGYLRAAVQHVERGRLALLEHALLRLLSCHLRLFGLFELT